MDSRRRTLIQSVTYGIVGLAGCLTSGRESTDTLEPTDTTGKESLTSSNNPSRSPTSTQNQLTKARICSTPTETDMTTPSAYQDYSAEGALPEPTNGWEMREITHSNGYVEGVINSARGIYNSPEDVVFTVDVLKMDDSNKPFNDLYPRSLAQNGWDIGVAYGRFLFAGGTGTYQLTHTPEKPPRLDRTPIPNTENQTRELLSYSPILSDEWISKNLFTCGK